VLTLGEVKEGDYSGLFVVGGVFGEDFVDAVVVFFGEVEVRFGGVVGGVDVLCVGRVSCRARGVGVSSEGGRYM
jgi:hypothetical protein